MNSSDDNNTGIPPSGGGAPPAPYAPVLVVSPAWLLRFAPPVANPAETHPAPLIPPPDDVDGDPFYVVAITLPKRAMGGHAVRASHLALRICAVRALRVIAMSSDGLGVAAVLSVVEAPRALMEDAGSPAACARLAVAIGVAPASWPATPAGRLDILLALLDTAGVHPEAPARTARMTAFSLGLNRDPTQIPVPLLDTEVEFSSRCMGIGAGMDLATLLTPEGMPRLLSTAEIDAVPTGRTDILTLFQEAALAVIRCRTSSTSATEERGAAQNP